MEMIDMRGESRPADLRDREAARRLRNMRKENNMSQLEVADKIGVSRTAYWKYESGKGGIPGKSLILLANLFGTTTDYLLCLKPDHRERANEPPIPAPPYLPKSQARSDLQSLLNTMNEDGIEMMLGIAKIIAERC